MKFIIVRHAETTDNKQGIIQGHRDPNLSSQGKLQAQKLAQRLKSEKIDEIYTSDLTRCKETAAAIAVFHPSVKIHNAPLLRERNHGEFEGKKQDEISKENYEKFFHTLEQRPKGGESWIDVGKRAEKFIQGLHTSDKTVLLVTHGGTIIGLLCLLTNTPAKQASKFFVQGNTCVNIVEVAEDKSHKVHVLNCTKH